MKYLICVLVIFVSVISCTRASLLPFILNPFQLKPLSSNNTESVTQESTTNETTTIICETVPSDSTDEPKTSGTSESSNLQEGQAKLGDLQQLLTAPLNILNLLFGPHNSHPNGGYSATEASNVQPQPHPPELLPSLPVLPIPLIDLPNFIARNSKQSSLTRGINDSPNSEEASSKTGKK